MTADCESDADLTSAEGDAAAVDVVAGEAEVRMTKK